MIATGARPPRSVVVAFGLIAMSVLLVQVVLSRLFASIMMGMPMPLGMGLVASSERLVLWGWSLNGVFSVLASVGAIYSAIYIGTTRTFAIAAAAYVLAGVMLQIVRRRPAASGV
jgi:hypothetical protein